MSFDDVKLKKKASIPQYFKGLFMASRSTVTSQRANDIELNDGDQSTIDRAAPVKLPRYVPRYTVNSTVLQQKDSSPDEPPRNSGDASPLFTSPQSAPKVRSAAPGETGCCTKKMLAAVIGVLLVAGGVSIAAGIAAYFTLRPSSPSSKALNTTASNKSALTTLASSTKTSNKFSTVTLETSSNIIISSSTPNLPETTTSNGAISFSATTPPVTTTNLLTSTNTPTKLATTTDSPTSPTTATTKRESTTNLLASTTQIILLSSTSQRAVTTDEATTAVQKLSTSSSTNSSVSKL